ncbi:D-alanine--D-alanine ligase [Gemella sp. GH3]|uniref:D-alanine--D-alanine ligase n=1 Tax=unclassified Gemella TaxID=2624949 RepID=UPI0015D08210|nr:MULTISPECIES: D-alanine--D-alanine ligase [unclassified Gemella]MBF0713979.1 D-alanine--D-alanine ligase [Gemella sp. GH3.1]NYS50931.1 D-alanine--D-alanine ligase [Gemella sp. GH3]
MKKETLAIIYGGKSSEHEVSLLTAKSIINEINQEKYNIFPIFIDNEGNWARGEKITKKIEDVKELIFNNFTKDIVSLLYVDNKKIDIVFPVLHGPNGEDGTIQGFFETIDIAYIGNNVISSATGMDKAVTKKIFSSIGLPQLPYVDFIANDWKHTKEDILQNIEQKLNYPMFVKPANLGSSVGISRCENKDKLILGIEEALKFDRRIVVEEGVVGAKEIEVSTLGYNSISSTDPGEICNISTSDFYDYDTKYTDGQSKMEIPANIDKNLYPIFREMAERAFKALDCSGLARVDFFLTKDGKIYINEINTMPGFTKFSMFPSLWNNMGISYSQIIETLIKLAKERYNERKLLKQ